MLSFVPLAAIFAPKRRFLVAVLTLTAVFGPRAVRRRALTVLRILLRIAPDGAAADSQRGSGSVRGSPFQ
jgi:hypothetical protein